jgi:hypothetical protein
VTFWRSLSASDRTAAKLMAASASNGRPALSSIPGTATIAATAVVARPNLNSALIGNRIDGPLDTLALGPICHKGFALPLSLRRHFEEKLNQSFKKLVISGTATVFRAHWRGAASACANCIPQADDGNVQRPERTG